MNNYPPGVTGNEYEISGPDWEQYMECTFLVSYIDENGDEQEAACGAPALAQGYDSNAWAVCDYGHEYELHYEETL